MACLRLFGPAREAAGLSRVTVPGERVSDVVAAAEARFGEVFAQVVAVSNIWVNGDAVEPETRINDDDEVAIIPPVSGG